jgi:hypothetical protein
MSRRVLITLAIIVIIIVVGMVVSVKRSASAFHRGDPGDPPPPRTAPAK